MLGSLHIIYDEVKQQNYNLSVSTYVAQEDKRERIDIAKLNAEIKEIVAREQVLRDAIDKMSCAFAEDLNAKSDEELLALYQEIQAILLARNGNYTVELASGKYAIGTDFPAGSYRIEAKGAYSSTQVKVYKNADEKYPSESYILAELYQSSVIGKLDVVSGNVLEIAGSVVTVSAYNAAQTPLNITVETDSLKDANQADTEMVDGLVVPSGKYLIGSEIAPGTYRVVCEEAYGMASVSVFDSEKAVFPSFNTLLSPLLGNAEIGKLDLKSGSYLEVSEGSVTLYVYKGLGK